MACACRLSSEVQHVANMSIASLHSQPTVSKIRTVTLSRQHIGAVAMCRGEERR